MHFPYNINNYMALIRYHIVSMGMSKIFGSIAWSCGPNISVAYIAQEIQLGEPGGGLGMRPMPRLVPRLLQRKTGKEPGRFDHMPRGVVCVVLIIEILPSLVLL